MNIARELIFVSFLLLLNTSLFSQNENTVLWKVTSPDGKVSSYMLGSYHTFSKKFVKRYDAIEWALQRSTCFLSETSNSFRLSNDLVFAYEDSLKWPNYTTPEKVKNITGFFLKEQGIWAFLVKRIHIAYLTYMYMQGASVHTIKKIDKPAGKFSMDGYLQNEARLNAIKRIPLETKMEHEDYFLPLMGFFTGDTNKIRSAVVTLDSLISACSPSVYCPDTLAAAYHNLSWNYNFEKEANTAWDSLLLTTRNKNWMPQLIKTCSTERAFIVVGIGHLGYKEGLIQLLRKENFSVEPVPITARK